MTTAAQLLTQLRARGVLLTISDGRLRAEAPRGVLTPEVRQGLTDRKAELVAVLIANERRLSLSECIALLHATFAEIRAKYECGALPWALANHPDLARRFRATEDRIDALAKSRPTEADFRAALTEHAAVWAEISGRYRAHEEQQGDRSDPMPELPEDTALAIGVSYGDGEPGTWDVVRRAR